LGVKQRNDTDFSNYSVIDTLQKYDEIDIEQAQNKANILAFLSDLNYLSGNIEEGNKLIEAAFEADSLALCEEYAVPLSKYLLRESPYRKTSVPGIFKGNFDQYISVYTKCINHEGLKRSEPSELISLSDYLWLNYIRILDQWYRIANKREMDGERQREYDKYCQDKLDEIFEGKAYPGTRDLRGILNVMILHSEDCDWSYKWLKKYIEAYKDDKFLSRHLNHFLYRSTCRDNQKTIDLINKTLSKI